jgi:glyoxylase-like metal-dependent hydrolase (beta-lactamase superfamily II)
MTGATTIQGFHDPRSGTISYVVTDNATQSAAVVDAVLDYDFKSGRTGTRTLDPVLDYIRVRGLTVQWILETHAHADHFSGARHLQERVGGRIAIGEQIRTVQSAFKKLYNLGDAFDADGSQFDHLLADGETLRIGKTEVQALLVPGHTPADLAYRIGDAVLVGDTLFMPASGSARADFPGGDARTLYRSMRRLLELPPQTRLFVCHDYPSDGGNPRWESTVAEQRRANIHVRDGISEEEFVAMRNARDVTLEVPALILPALQVNIRAGRLPPAEDNGIAYLRIPLNAFPGTS